MKKLLSILFALTIILSGLHISMATHICGGEVAAVKWSVSEQLASCGMVGMDKEIPSEPTLSPESCCKNEVSEFIVDSNYNPSVLQNNAPDLQVLQVFYIPEIIGLLSISSNNSLNTNVQPPGNYIASAVSLPRICVFLI